MPCPYCVQNQLDRNAYICMYVCMYMYLCMYRRVLNNFLYMPQNVHLLLLFPLLLVIKILSVLFYHLKYISSNLVLLYVITKQITKVSFYYRPCFY
jgi:hypothetical protein